MNREPNPPPYPEGTVFDTKNIPGMAYIIEREQAEMDQEVEELLSNKTNEGNPEGEQ